MTLLDGKALSDKIKEEVKVEVEQLQREKHITPGLAVILVGNDAASATYVGMKAKSCKNAGIYSVVHEMPNTISQDEILDIIDNIIDLLASGDNFNKVTLEGDKTNIIIEKPNKEKEDKPTEITIKKLEL